MALDIQYISLDVSKKPTSQQVRLGQGDANATQIVVSIFDEGVLYDLTGYDVRLSMRLPKNGGYYQVDGTTSGNVATFDVDELYAASVAGVDGFGYVDILDGDSIVCSTSRFQLVVLQCVTDGVEVAPQYVDAINDAIDRTLAAAEAAEGVVLQDVPLMSETLRGGAQVGDGLDVEDGALYVDATGIANGALPVAHGGTGSTSASDARTALGAAASSHNHAASDINSGQLAIAQGGTGASTAAGAKAAIVDGQALAPASVAATGAVSGSSISDGTGTLAQLRESVTPTAKQALAPGCTYQKVGKLVVMRLDNYQVSGSRTEIGYLPNGYKPADYCVAPAYGTTTNGYFDANTNGRVTVQASGNAFATLVYFTA